MSFIPASGHAGCVTYDFRPPALYAFDAPSDSGFVWSGAHRPDMGVPPPPLQNTRSCDQTPDTEQLMMKRNEIIK